MTAAIERTAEAIQGKDHRVCPWWVAYLFDNPVRRMINPADNTLAPYVHPGMHVLDFGCGFGHYSLGLARLVGAKGSVWSADVQQQMLNKTMKRARKQKLGHIINPLLCAPDGIGRRLELDFIIASHSIHETPDPAKQLKEFHALLKTGGQFLLLEPPGHLKAEEFENEINAALQAGFKRVEEPSIKRSMCVLFKK